MEQIVDLERRIELALNEIERSVSLYSKNSGVGSEPANQELEKLSLENEKLEPSQHNNHLAILDEIKIDKITPKQALQILYQLKQVGLDLSLDV